jgi:hypothetical protein
MENRRFERYTYDTPADYEVAGERYHGHIDDISRRGVLLKFELISELEIGKILAVWIPATDGAKRFKMLGRVAWIKGNTAGIEFI